LREQIRAAILEEGPLDFRTAVLVGLLHSSSALDQVLTREEMRARQARLEEIDRAHTAGWTAPLLAGTSEAVAAGASVPPP
ncbi:MAG TPA: GPP34 family phosphoprotein, partial [Armatimonadota bacterium]|nr:GPP34 family phosphoprotein [Armatimonadota bacterium]